MRGLALRLVCSVLASVGAASCSDDDDTGAAGDSDVVADTTGEVSPSGPDWSCLGDPVRRPPLGPTLDLELEVIDLLTREPVEGVSITGCNASDPDCLDPVAELTTDADGRVTATIPVEPEGWTGWAEMVKEGYIPMIMSASVPVTRAPPESPLRVWLTSRTSLDAAALITGTTIDDERGHVLAMTWDCAQMPAAGATVSADSEDGSETRYYVVEEPASGTVIASATATATDARGAGGFFNLPAGEVTLQTVLETGGQNIAVGTTEIRAGWMTGILMIPNQ